MTMLSYTVLNTFKLLLYKDKYPNKQTNFISVVFVLVLTVLHIVLTFSHECARHVGY